MFLLFAMVVLGWGYWHMVTHATLNLSLQDVSLKTDRQAYGGVVSADIVFMDATVRFWLREESTNRRVSFRSLILKSVIAAVMSKKQVATLMRDNHGSVALK